MKQLAIDSVTAALIKRGESPSRGGTINGTVYGVTNDIGRLPIESRFETGLTHITLAACTEGLFLLSGNAMPTTFIGKLLSFFDGTPKIVFDKEWAAFIPKSQITSVSFLQIPMSRGGVMVEYIDKNGMHTQFSVNVSKGDITEFLSGNK